MPKFDTYPSSGTLISTDLFGISRSPFTAGTFFSTTPDFITGYVEDNGEFDVGQIANLPWAAFYGYQSITSAVSTSLTNPLSAINDLTFTVAGTVYTLTLPPMNQVSVNLDNNSTFIINNKGSNPFTVLKQDGITTVDYLLPGESLQITVTDNSTANGIFQTVHMLQRFNYYISRSEAANFSFVNPIGNGLIKMRLVMTVGGQSYTLPAMNATNSPAIGTTFMVYNAGSFDFDLKSNGGATIVSASAGEVVFIQLQNNSTAAGTWDVLVNGNLSIPIPVTSGGTGAITAPAALVSLGAASHLSDTPVGASYNLANPLKVRYDIDYSNFTTGKVNLPAMDAATAQAVGFSFIINNTGVETFDVYYNDTSTPALLNIMPSHCALFTVTSVATSNGSVSAINLSDIPSIDSENGASYTIQSTNYDGVVNYAPSVTATIIVPQTSNVPLEAGYHTLVVNNTTSDVNYTFTPEGTDTIVGDLVIAPTSSAIAFKLVNGSPNTWFTAQLGNLMATQEIAFDTTLADSHHNCTLVIDSSAMRTLTIDGNNDLRTNFQCDIVNENSNYFLLINCTNGANLNGSTYFYMPPQSSLRLYQRSGFYYYAKFLDQFLIQTGTTTGVQTVDLSNAAEYITVPNNTVLQFSVDIIARRTDVVGDSGGWRLFGTCKNVAGTVTMVGTPTFVTSGADAGLTVGAVITGSTLRIQGQYTAITSVFSWMATNFTLGVEQ